MTTPSSTPPEMPPQTKAGVALMIGFALGGLGVPALTNVFTSASAQARPAAISTICVNSNSAEDVALVDGGRDSLVRADITGQVWDKLPDGGQMARSIRKAASWPATVCDQELFAKAKTTLEQ